jgi:Fe-S cluster assembly protein SufA
MAVETYDPLSKENCPEAHISASDAAITHLNSQQQNNPQALLRLDLTNSGCSGYKYNLEFVKQLETDDIEFKLAESLLIYVPKIRFAMLKGTQIDYVTEGLNASIKYTNPNADAECGCGESFSLKDSASTST